jgi:hypothetical protein
MEGDDTAADAHTVPDSLMNAMMESPHRDDDLVSLACMNVIMPTAMITMHTDKDMSQQSARTAERGIRVLQALRERLPIVSEECHAILAVAQGRGGEINSGVGGAKETKIAYWNDFFDKWKYQETQKKDIGKAMEVVLTSE